VITPPSSGVYAEARRRLDALAKPTGALGRLEDLAAWMAACQGTCPPRPLDRVRAVILAGDHGVSHDDVSAYPREITPVMVRAFVAGVAGANCLARQHGVALRVLDLGVDDDLDDLPAEVSVYHLGPSEPIDRADALTSADCRQALRVGEMIAKDEISAGADLLIIGDMGIGNTTPAAALMAATLGLRADEVVGRGSGVDGDRLQHKTEVIEKALARRIRSIGLRRWDLPISLQGSASFGRLPRAAYRCCSMGSSRSQRPASLRTWSPASSRGAPLVTARLNQRSSWPLTSWAWNQLLISVCDSVKAPVR
jgi:nicotinate-nucleotide--dimethylbenzimidazole phosphoribosyltransferase